MGTIKESCKDVATRMVNAENAFIELVVERCNCTKSEAEKVLGLYLKLKVAKYDIVGGVINIKHGIFLDKDILINAINQ